MSVVYRLIDVIDLSKQFEGIEPHFTWRIYINKDQRSGRYKVVVIGEPNLIIWLTDFLFKNR